MRRELQQHGRDLTVTEPFCFVLGVLTDHARVPGFAAVGIAWSSCNSFDMPTSQILAFSDRSSSTAARKQEPVSLSAQCCVPYWAVEYLAA